jgi:riboflavin synthase
MSVSYGESNLGVGGVGVTYVTGDTDQVFEAAGIAGRNQADMFDEIELSKLRQLLIAQVVLETEETIIDRFFAEAMEMLEQPLAIVGLDRANMNQATVKQRLVNLVVSWVQASLFSAIHAL